MTSMNFTIQPFVDEAYRLLAGERYEQTASHSMTVRYLSPVPLLTGKLAGRSRADHARALRVARLERRAARRAKRPVRTIPVTVHLPRVTVTSA